MITKESLQKLAIQYQTNIFPNIVREYFQHIFLGELYKLPESHALLFKGGTALRVIYGSPRFSEDLDFSVAHGSQHGIHMLVENLFVRVLTEIERTGFTVDVSEKSGSTRGGYFGMAKFTMLDFQPVSVEINISSRRGKSVKGEVDTIANDFVPPYTLVHLPQDKLVEEKVFGALATRKKPRDFYDLYFLMRKNMLSGEHKKRLKEIKDDILESAKKIDFRGELGVFLPANQQAISRDFYKTLVNELRRQIN